MGPRTWENTGHHGTTKHVNEYHRFSASWTKLTLSGGFFKWYRRIKIYTQIRTFKLDICLNTNGLDIEI